MSFENLLNKYCSIETCSVAVDTNTGEKKITWQVTSQNVACRVYMRSAKEMLTDQSEYSKSTHILYMKYRQLDNIENRLSLDGNTYNITAISDMGCKQKYLAVYLERTK